MNFRTATTSARSAIAASSTKNRVRAAVVTGVLVAAPVAGLVSATGAQAADTSTWDKVASCESTNNWSANTGNGFSGGLQFTPSTWAAYGGGQYASSADQASRGQQIAVAENVLASQGPGAWPVCGPEAGLTAGGTPASTDTSGTGSTGASQSTSSDNGSSASSSASVGSDTDSTPAPTSSTGGAFYTVGSGDTLGSIAAAHGTTWKALYNANLSTVGANPDDIFPGQTLTIG